jgi:hypothetical protein
MPTTGPQTINKRQAIASLSSAFSTPTPSKNAKSSPSSAKPKVMQASPQSTKPAANRARLPSSSSEDESDESDESENSSSSDEEEAIQRQQIPSSSSRKPPFNLFNESTKTKPITRSVRPPVHAQSSSDEETSDESESQRSSDGDDSASEVKNENVPLQSSDRFKRFQALIDSNLPNNNEEEEEEESSDDDSTQGDGSDEVSNSDSDDGDSSDLEEEKAKTVSLVPQFSFSQSKNNKKSNGANSNNSLKPRDPVSPSITQNEGKEDSSSY